MCFIDSKTSWQGITKKKTVFMELTFWQENWQ